MTGWPLIQFVFSTLPFLSSRTLIWWRRANRRWHRQTIKAGGLLDQLDASLEGNQHFMSQSSHWRCLIVEWAKLRKIKVLFSTCSTCTSSFVRPQDCPWGCLHLVCVSAVILPYSHAKLTTTVPPDTVRRFMCVCVCGGTRACEPGRTRVLLLSGGRKVVSWYRCYFDTRYIINN